MLWRVRNRNASLGRSCVASTSTPGEGPGASPCPPCPAPKSSTKWPIALLLLWLLLSKWGFGHCSLLLVYRRVSTDAKRTEASPATSTRAG